MIDDFATIELRATNMPVGANKQTVVCAARVNLMVYQLLGMLESDSLTEKEHFSYVISNSLAELCNAFLETYGEEIAAK